MTGAGISTLAALRSRIARLEAYSDATAFGRVALGHVEADAALQGGLALGAVHEVFAEEGHSAAATGFVAGMARRLSDTKFVMWVRQDFSARENGDLAMSGFAELGLDPRRIMVVRAANVESVLRVSADGLGCNALGVVVSEIWGETREFDLTASRKLTLAAQQSGVSAVMLRIAAQPAVSTAETRWIVRAAHSPPDAPWRAWGAPVLDAQLLRNRHGLTGHWTMEWKCDECLFRETAAHPQPVAAAPAHRSHQAPARAKYNKRQFG